VKVTELREVLDERSRTTPDEVMQHLRLAGVKAKVRTRRRRRAIAWTAVGAILVMGGIAFALAPLSSRTSSPPAAAPATIGGFPEYAFGAHVLTAESTTLPDRRIELAVTPNSNPDFVVLTRCSEPTLEVEITLDGNVVSTGTCRPGATEPIGLRKDRTSRLMMTVLSAAPGSTAEYGVAVGRPVAFPEYPLPLRPSQVKPLAVTVDRSCAAQPCGEPMIVRADRDDPRRPQKAKIRWHDMRGIEAVSQTPGHLSVTIDGISLGTGTWWSYDQTVVPFKPSLNIPDGTVVTVEVTPEYVTGDWQVVLTPEP
jgi:hypothetical protein